MQLTAAQTSLEPHPHRVSRTGRRPFVSQNTRRRRQPTRERARPAQRPRIPDPRAPGDDLNKLPTLSPSRSATADRPLCAEHPVQAHADTARCARFAARSGRPSRSAASEPEASQAARLRPQGHDRRARLNAVHVPRRWSLRRRVERGSDARPAIVRLGRPALVRPRLRDARQCARLGHSRSVTLEYHVRVADRHRDRAPGITRDIESLARARARLEPERACRPATGHRPQSHAGCRPR